MPVAVMLSQWICAGGQGCLSSRNVSIIIFASFAFKNSVPNSSSAADAAKMLSIWHRVNITRLRWMG